MNTFDNFFILFTEGELHIGRRRIPLGQICTEILNRDDETFDSLATAAERFYASAMRLFQMRDKQHILDAQKSANAVFDIVLKLPPYCYIPMDLDLHYNIFTYLYLHTDQWDEAMTEGTTGRRLFLDMFENVRRLPKALKTFRSDVSYMLDNYFENLPARTKRTESWLRRRRTSESFRRFYTLTSIAGSSTATYLAAATTAEDTFC